MNMHILVTGGCGFIGSNFIPYFLEQNAHHHIVNIDALTYAGDPDNLKEVKGHARYTFIEGDICDRNLVGNLFQKYDIQGVVHFAAESHVDNSISGPDAFVRTNIMGTYTLLEAAREHWMMAPGTYRKGYENCRFHHISTDEVYGSLSKEGLFTEHTPYAPNSPYSATKASSDHLVRSYHHTFGLNTVTTNCSNNYGPKQHHEKLIPTIIGKALGKQPIPIYGDGSNVRDWLYVKDHCKGLALAFAKGRSGETYNIGGNNERNNLYIAEKTCTVLDELVPLGNQRSYTKFITFVTDRAGHDFRYAIDASKIIRELGWKAHENFETGIVKTVKWYLKKYGKQPGNIHKDQERGTGSNTPLA